MKRALLYKPAVHVFLILLLGFISYSNSFHTSFHFDDEPNIVVNPIIKDLRLYSSPSKARVFHNPGEYPMLKQRYIGSLTFAMNYRLHRLDVRGYHIVNFFIHIIVALLVYYLVVVTFRSPFFNTSALRDYSRPIAFYSALLFAVHPVQTQAVTYIVQRFASLATLFYLFSLVMYVRARFSSTSALTLTWYFLSLISAVLAMKTKEIAFTLPVVIALYEFMFFEGKIKKRILYLMPLLLTMLIIPLTLVGADRPIGELIGEVSGATRLKTDMSRVDYLFTQFSVIVTYITLLFIPVGQNLDYDFPVYQSFFDPIVFLSFILLLSIFGMGIYLVYRYRNTVPHTRLISFGIFWFFITLSVESSVIPIVDVIFEHRVYLPSVGFFIVISLSAVMLIKRVHVHWQRIIVSAFAIIPIVLTFAAYERNTVWKDEISLWRDVVKKSPNKARAHNNLGTAFRSRGSIDEAAKQYEIAIKLNPEYSLAHNNLGSAYKVQGFIDRAVKQYMTALEINPDLPDAHNNLGIIYGTRGIVDKAIEYFETAIRLNPAFSGAHYNLGVAYGSTGMPDRALESYRMAVKLNPKYLAAYNNLGDIYKAQGLPDEAIKQYLIAIELKPDWAGMHYKLGRIYHEKGEREKARRELETVLRINPRFPEAEKLLHSIVKKN